MNRLAALPLMAAALFAGGCGSDEKSAGSSSPATTVAISGGERKIGTQSPKPVAKRANKADPGATATGARLKGRRFPIRQGRRRPQG